VRNGRLSRRVGRRPSRLVGLLVARAVVGALHLRPVIAEEDDSATELAKKTQNPVTDLISVPFQNDFNFDTGSKDATVYILNVGISSRGRSSPSSTSRRCSWARTRSPAAPSVSGDINPSFFLSPAKPGHFIWGLGPTFTLPTATDFRLGSREFSMGPNGVALMMATVGTGRTTA